MGNEVVGYSIVENGTIDLVERDVQDKIEQGWVPSGPLVIKDSQMLQVMVKFK